MKNSYIIIFCFLCVGVFAQNHVIDSIKKIIATSKTDTVLIKSYNELGEIFFFQNPDTALYYLRLSNKVIQKNLDYHNSKNVELQKLNQKLFLKKYAITLDIFARIYAIKNEIKQALEYYNKSISTYRKINDSAGVSMEFYNIGVTYTENDKLQEAIFWMKKSLDIRLIIQDDKTIGASLNNLGVLYSDIGDVKTALFYLEQALKIREKLNDKKGIAKVLINIGNIYSIQNQNVEALKKYEQSLKLKQEIGDRLGESKCYNNMGEIYSKQNLFSHAMDCFLKSLKIREQIGNKKLIASALINIGNVYKDNHNFSLAQKNLNNALTIATESKSKPEINGALLALAENYMAQNDLNQTILYGNKSLTVAKEINIPERIMNSAALLKEAYTKTNNYKKALEMYTAFISMRDSIFNIETKSASIKNQLKHDFEKKSISDSLKNINEKRLIQTQIALQKAEIKQQLVLKRVLIIGLLLISLFVIFYYRRYKLTERQKNIITEQQVTTQKQKKEIEYKNNLITQSIDYSKRIQDAFIQSEDVIKLSGKEYFLFNQPKDIVSGDFLWAKKTTNGLLFAVADCTGHGVPGAFMSLVSYNLLEQASEIKHMNQPHLVLNEVNINLKKALKVKEGKTSYEGMDIVLCELNFTTNILYFAGTKHRLCVCRNNEIKQYRTENIIIGTDTNKEFNLQQLSLEKNDTVYLFTDGFPDQKGGDKRLKLYYEPFINLLKIQNADSLNGKKDFLISFMNSWKKNEDQIDDMLVFGLRI